MSENYEYIIFKAHMGTIFDWAPKWGQDGWEVISILADGSQPGSGEFHASARRLKHNWQPWEYHFFYDSKKSKGWNDHISSCGWSVVMGGIGSYGQGGYIMVKRPGYMAGTDDGDIGRRLFDLECLDGAADKCLEEILDLKWQRSRQEGRNIGTYAAVLVWIATVHLPRLYGKMGIRLPNEETEQLLEYLRYNFPKGLLDQKVLLDVAHRRLPDILRASGLEPPNRDPVEFAQNLLQIRGEFEKGKSVLSMTEIVHLLKRQLDTSAGKDTRLSLEELAFELARYRGDLRGGISVPKWVKEFWKTNQIAVKD